MNVKERIISLKLLEKIEKTPSLSNKLGVECRMHNVKDNVKRRYDYQTGEAYFSTKDK